MISAALYEYLVANSGAASIYPSQAPQSAALPTLVIDKIGDDRDRHWATNGQVATGFVTSEFELTVWAATQVAALNETNSLLTLMDMFTGVWFDTSTSPNTAHQIGLIEAE